MCIYRTSDGVCTKFTNEKYIEYCNNTSCPHEELSSENKSFKRTNSKDNKEVGQIVKTLMKMSGYYRI